MSSWLDLHAGLALSALLCAPALGTGWRTTRAVRGAARGVALALVALAQLTLTTLAAGLAGQLALGPLIALQWVALAVVSMLTRGQVADARLETDPGPTGFDALAASLPVAALALPALALGLVRGLLAPPLNWDSLAYHLPFALGWLRAGAIGGFAPLPHYPEQVTYFPGGGDLVWTWPLAAFGTDFAVGTVNHAFLVLNALAIGALARRLGARPATCAIAAVLWTLVPMHHASLLGTANVELYLTFTLLAAALFFTRDAGAQAPLAALACGLMLGIKLTALMLAPLAAGLGLAAGWRPSARAAALCLALVILPGGYWYVRNALATGTPLYPLPGGTLALAERFADGPLTPARWRELAEAVWSMLGVWGAVAALAWLVHLHRALTGPERALHLTWTLMTAALVASWSVTPNTARYLDYNLRYMLPGLALAAVSIAVALEHTHLPEPVLIALGTATAGAQLLELATHLALPARWTLTALAGLALGALAARASLTLRAGRARPVASTALILLVALAGLDLFAVQIHAAHHAPPTRSDWFLAGYHDGLFRDAAAWADALPGARLALAGPLPPYYFLGSRFQNRVDSLSVEPDGACLPHEVPGGRLRTHPDRAAWQRALAAARPDYVVTTNLPDQPFPPEDAWAAADPAHFKLAATHAHWHAWQVTP